MKSNEDIIKLTNRHVASTYGRLPIALVKGKGTRVWDASGKKYIDFVAGLAVDNLGHCHPAVVKAIRKQAGILLHVSNLYHIEPQSLLAAELTRQSFADKFFFCNSGAEANEAAIKLARRFSFDQGFKNRFEIITMQQSFHGRTLAALSATAQKKYHEGFSPMVSGFKYVPYNDPDAVEKAVSKKTCAVLVEPIQGEGGVNIPDKNYLKTLRKICNAKNILLILDEVQTGFGRTGPLFAYEKFGVKPDIITLAKAMGGGMAIGALGANNKVIKSFVPGTHAATFGGNPLACAAGLASLNVLTQKGFLKTSQETGEYFIARLKNLQSRFPVIQEVQGSGLMIRMIINQSGREILLDCMEQGYLINCIQDNILRFIPPLTITRKEIDQLIKALSRSFQNLKANGVL